MGSLNSGTARSTGTKLSFWPLYCSALQPQGIAKDIAKEAGQNSGQKMVSSNCVNPTKKRRVLGARCGWYGNQSREPKTFHLTHTVPFSWFSANRNNGIPLKKTSIEFTWLTQVWSNSMMLHKPLGDDFGIIPSEYIKHCSR
eukprot:scaffold813_cov148-Amphora_coffeaeformis.AAC.2